MASYSWYRTLREATKFVSSSLVCRLELNGDNMKKQNKTKARADDMVRFEFDFSKGVRGKHAERYASGTNVVVLEPDVASEFPTADEVNETLRAVARLIERRKKRNKRETA